MTPHFCQLCCIPDYVVSERFILALEGVEMNCSHATNVVAILIIN